MPVNTDPRTGRLYFKKQVRLPDGTSVRIRGVPKDYGQPETETGTKLAESIAIARLLATGSTKPPPPDGPSAPAQPKAIPTVSELMPTWLERAKATNKQTTVDWKESAARNHFLPVFGHLRLDEITKASVDDWHTSLVTKLKLEPPTVDGLLSSFKSFLNFAVERDIIAKAPKFPKQKVPDKEKRFLSFEEADQLIAAPPPATKPPWSTWKARVMHAMVVVGIRTGLRHGELIALRWQNVDLLGGKLWVRENRVDTSEGAITGEPKGGTHREVPLSNDAMLALRSIKQKRWDLVFTLDGAYLKYEKTLRDLKFICRAARMLPIGWHALRHTFASHLVMRGVAIVTVQRLMGHANIRMTLKYAHLSPHVSREAVMLLDEPAPISPNTKRRAAKVPGAPHPSPSV